MSLPETEPDGIQQRLARAESQLRQIKILLIALMMLIVAWLVPPVGALLGFTLFVGGVAFAVLLFIALVVKVLDEASTHLFSDGH